VTPIAEVLGVLAAVAVLAGGLQRTMPVPWGGEVPTGLTVAIALPTLFGPGRAGGIAAAGLLADLFLARRQIDALQAGRRLARYGSAALVAVLAGVVLGGHDPLLVAGVAAAGVVATEAAWCALGGAGSPVRLRSALPIYLTLACAGVLFAVAAQEVGVAMAAVAALPLLVTRTAFRRYAEATTTLQQTVQALGLVPELAGLVPLGHSERAAMYARAVAAELDFDGPSTERIVIATRLHHLGAVQDGQGIAPTTPADVAATGARILRDAGFPADVADLLEHARADGQARAPHLAAAVVRVATAFDHAVGDDPDAVDRGLTLLSTLHLDPFGRQAAAALLAAVATRPDLVLDALSAGARFRDAGAGLDLDDLVAEAAGADLLPFTTHRS
jgi:hypothetical protein